ncbi:MAG: ABC-F family ATP-binding cassette domain-containing protein [Alphaproteobacteria bacterium]|nr:ABC-F family ATP-binding cassette domain-containing protein [Alphaproteobacteria bacterium]
MLTLDNITCRVAGRLLLEGASVTIPAGHHVGLVGRNGTGKSTLLRLIGGEFHADDGEVRLAGKPRVGWVKQEAPGGAEGPLEVVLAADEERSRLLAEAETATDPHRIADIQHRLVDIDAHSAESRAARILSGLGFDEEMQARPLADFSGGWRMRVALAGVLFSTPDLLLLDEPTNHLDLEAAMWLEGHLKAYPHTFLLVSHDRDLLNATAQSILHIAGQKLTFYRGNYDQFEKARRERQAQAEATRAKQDAQRKHMQAFIDRFRYKASKARQAQSRIKALERMEPVAEIVNDPSVAFRFPEPEELPPPLVTFDAAATGYEAEKPILTRIGVRVDPDDRIALIGRNGNGKSTFAKLLARRLELMGGEVHRAAKLRVGFFAQHQIEDLDPKATPLDLMARKMVGEKPDKVRARIAQFGLGAEKAETEVERLSGGERARLTLALVTHDAPHLLILDEPTNHLDIDAREALVHAVNSYPGAVIVVSHDRHLVELTADRLLLVAGGRVRPFDGDLKDYTKAVLSGGDGSEFARDDRVQLAAPTADNAKPEKARATAPAAAPEADKKQQRQQAAAERARLAPYRKKVQAAETKVTRLEQEIARLEEQLGDQSLYEPARKADLTDLLQRKAATEKGLAKAEEEWMAAEAALEEAASQAA